MKLKHVIWVLTALVAVVAMAAGVAVLINRYLAKKNNTDYIECDCEDDDFDLDADIAATVE